MRIKKVFVVGAGTMGNGIAQVCAQAGYDVVMMDMNDEILREAVNSIKRSVEKLMEKGKVQGTVDDIVTRIRTTTDMQDGKEAEIVIEAVNEDLAIKRDIFCQLDDICLPHTILGSNTSSISITSIAGATTRPDKVVGIHFWNPVPIMRLVEIIKGLLTSEETIETALEFAHSLGKETIRVNKDVPGFAINRFNVVSTVEAIRLVEEGVATIEDIDKGARLGLGRPMGPFETSDLNGLDVGVNILQGLYEETGDPKFFPPLTMRQKVKAGQLGRKTRVGWYRYDENGNKIGPA